MVASSLKTDKRKDSAADRVQAACGVRPEDLLPAELNPPPDAWSAGLLEKLSALTNNWVTAFRTAEFNAAKTSPDKARLARILGDRLAAEINSRGRRGKKTLQLRDVEAVYADDVPLDLMQQRVNPRSETPPPPPSPSPPLSQPSQSSATESTQSTHSQTRERVSRPRRQEPHTPLPTPSPTTLGRSSTASQTQSIIMTESRRSFPTTTATSFFPPRKRCRTSFFGGPNDYPGENMLSEPLPTNEEDDDLIRMVTEKTLARAKKYEEAWATLLESSKRLADERSAAEATRAEAAKAIEAANKKIGDKEQELEDLEKELRTAEELRDGMSAYRPRPLAEDDAGSHSARTHELRVSVDWLERDCSACRHAIDELREELEETRSSIATYQTNYDDAVAKEDETSAALARNKEERGEASERLDAWRVYNSAIAVGPQKLSFALRGCMGDCSGMIRSFVDELQHGDEADNEAAAANPH